MPTVLSPVVCCNRNRHGWKLRNWFVLQTANLRQAKQSSSVVHTSNNIEINSDQLIGIKWISIALASTQLSTRPRGAAFLALGPGVEFIDSRANSRSEYLNPNTSPQGRYIRIVAFTYFQEKRRPACHQGKSRLLSTTPKGRPLTEMILLGSCKKLKVSASS